MKTCKLFSVAAAAALVLLTSCLGETSNSFSASQFAVGGTSSKNYKTILNTSIGPIYSTVLDTKVLDGTCYKADFEVNLDSPENGNVATTGYYVANIGALMEVDKGNTIYYSIPDTAKLIENEIPLQNVLVYPELGVYVEGHLFAGASYTALKDQKNTWMLYCDRNQKATTDNNVHTYNVFLRAIKKTEGTGTTSTSTGVVNAFKIEDAIKAFEAIEKADKQSTFKLKVNYLNSINEKDSTDLKWKSFDLNFAVTQK